MFKKVLATGVILAAVVSAAQAQSPVNVYNATTFSGVGYTNPATPATVNGSNTTAMLADDITTLAYGAGKVVTTFAFNVLNFNSTAVSVSPLVTIYNTSPTTGGPGTLIAAIQFGSITEPAGTVTLYNASTVAAGYFTIPSSGTFWAGMSYVDTTNTLSNATLSSFGQGTYTPTVGSSQDVFFQATAPSAPASNPAGSFLYFGGSPAADFGWSFSVAPEPSEYAAFGLGLLGLGGLTLKARRRNYTV